MSDSIFMGKHLRINAGKNDSKIFIDWAYVEKAVNYHERLVAHLKMSAGYVQVEGSEDEDKLTEDLFKELGLDDDT